MRFVPLFIAQFSLKSTKNLAITITYCLSRETRMDAEQ